MFSTSIRDLPSRSTRQTTTVSPGSAYSSSRFIAARSIAVLLPEVTSEKTSRFWTPALTRASSWRLASWLDVLTRVYPRDLTPPFWLRNS